MLARHSNGSYEFIDFVSRPPSTQSFDLLTVPCEDYSGSVRQLQRRKICTRTTSTHRFTRA